MGSTLSLLLLLTTPPPAYARVPDWVREYEARYAARARIPSFSRQTGLACNVCHTAFPMLTAFGRQFKLNAYTLTGLQTIGPTEPTPSPLKINLIPPVSTMVQTSFTQTAKAQPGTQNGNVEFPQQLSVFFGEAISPRIGTFIQITYDAVAGSVGMDNISLRYAKHGKLASKPVLWGVTVNNSPTVQDVWNSTPVWGYPFASSGVAPTPAAAPLVDGSLAQNVAGLGTYALWADHVYGELTVYRSAPQGGAHPPDASSELITKGVVPYWRFAYQRTFGTQYLEVGTYGLAARLYPTGVTGPTAEARRDVRRGGVGEREEQPQHRAGGCRLADGVPLGRHVRRLRHDRHSRCAPLRPGRRDGIRRGQAQQQRRDRRAAVHAVDQHTLLAAVCRVSEIQWGEQQLRRSRAQCVRQ